MDHREFARLGGIAYKKKYGRNGFVQMGKKSGEARRKKKALRHNKYVLFSAK